MDVRDVLDRYCFPFQPIERQATHCEVAVGFLVNLGVVGVEPGDFLWGEEGGVDEFSAHGDHGDVLEAEVSMGDFPDVSGGVRKGSGREGELTVGRRSGGRS